MKKILRMRFLEHLDPVERYVVVVCFLAIGFVFLSLLWPKDDLERSFGRLAKEASVENESIGEGDPVPEAESFQPLLQGYEKRPTNHVQPYGGRATPAGRAALARPVQANLNATFETVRSGDTLTTIAERRLGDVRRWREILEMNPGVAPDRLRAGMRLAMPSSSAGVGSARAASFSSARDPIALRAASPRRMVTVRKGETLSTIAERELGDWGLWRELADLNGIRNVSLLRVGQTLILP